MGIISKTILFTALITAAFTAASFADISQESYPLSIKGSRIFSFSSKSLEGTKEGYTPGVAREESLRINVSGVVDGTDIDANFFSTSLLGGFQTASREESVSIKLKRGSTEAYFGDFTPLMDDLEFAQINKVLSGLQIAGGDEKYGFKLIASSPKGRSRFKKMYGDGSQGPYNLGDSPIVINSERVTVDNELQKRGNDYEIDYQAGTITFKQKTINSISIIEVNYDFRETVFQHSTYAFRGKAKVNDTLKAGITYIDDSDSLKDAQEITTATSAEPQSHRVIGIDGQLDLGPPLLLKGEAAMSDRNLNLLDPQLVSGKALKLDLQSQLGSLLLSGKFKKIGTNYLSVGDALPKQALTEYGAQAYFKPNDIFLSQGSASESKYIQSGANYKISNKTGRIKLTVPRLPSAEYVLMELLDSNDPVTASPIDRITSKDSLEFQHSAGALKTSLKGSREKRTTRTPSEESTVYKILNAGISFSTEETFSMTSNLELKETDLSNQTRPITKTYITNISASPNKSFLFAGSLNYIDDSQAGISQVTDLSLKADPINRIKTNFKHRISTVKENFGSTQEAVRREEGSYLLELRPIDRLKIKYNYKPSFTILSRTLGTTYNNQTQQLETSFFLFAETLLGYSYQLGNAYLTDKTDYPLFVRKQNTQDTDTSIYSIKTAPLKFLSCEFNYVLDNKKILSLASTSEPSYNKENDRTREFNAAIKTSLSEKIAVDSSYSRKTSKIGSLESEDNLLNTLNQAGSIKIIFNLNDALTVSPSYSYSQLTDYLQPANQDTYTLGPGIGLILRIMDRLRIDSSLTYAKSHAGSNTEDTNFSLRGKYDLSDYVHITLLAKTELSKNPDFKTSEFSGNVEINL